MIVGKVLANPAPSSTQFSFLVTGKVLRNMFVQLDSGIVARVTEIYKGNRYLENAENLHYFESSGVDIRNRFPVSQWEYGIAEARIAGRLGNGLERNVSPPSPGEEVRIIDKEILARILGFDDKGLELGTLDYHNIPVKLNMTKLLQKHLAILAMSGAGKSYAASVLVEELLERSKEVGRIGIVLIDVHGEYLGFAERPREGKDYSLQTKVIRDVKIGAPELSSGMFAEFCPGMSPIQRRELDKILGEMAKENSGETYTLNDIIERITSSGINQKTQSALVSWMYDLQSTGLFSDHSRPSIRELVKPGQLTIVDLSSFTDLRRKQIIVTWLAKRLFEERRKEVIAPFLLIIEEAHNFAKENASRDQVLSKGIIETIAREGRKFGASLCLITQRPIQLSTTALSQCNNQLILRVTNPYDLKHIGESSEAIDQSSLDSITTLRVGEALLVGEAVNFPIFFKVRKRKSQELKLGKDLEEMAREFEESISKREEDAKAFL